MVSVLVVIIIHQCLVGADAGVVIHIAGLGHADDGMNDQRAFDFRRGAFGQFFVDAMQGLRVWNATTLSCPISSSMARTWAGVWRKFTKS